MITVSPTVFTKVRFEAPAVAAVAQTALERIEQLPADLDVLIEVDENAATNRVKVSSIDPVIFMVESGALEHYPVPRTMGQLESDITFSRLFLEVVDRRSERFQSPPLGQAMSHAERMAWDVNLYGRTSRLGLRVSQPRYRYNFRNRHGFSDLADRIFDKLWGADDLTWSEIRDLSARAVDPVIEARYQSES